jgi:hypothetical protein
LRLSAAPAPAVILSQSRREIIVRLFITVVEEHGA